MLDVLSKEGVEGFLRILIDFKVDVSMTVLCFTKCHLVVELSLIQSLLMCGHDLLDEFWCQLSHRLFGQFLLPLSFILCLFLKLHGRIELASLMPCSLISQGDTILGLFLRWTVLDPIELDPLTIQWRRRAHVVSHRDNFVEKDPGVVTSSEDAVDVFICESSEMGESSSHFRVTQA